MKAKVGDRIVISGNRQFSPIVSANCWKLGIRTVAVHTSSDGPTRATMISSDQVLMPPLWSPNPSR